jgi:hypothetical protein
MLSVILASILIINHIAVQTLPATDVTDTFAMLNDAQLTNVRGTAWISGLSQGSQGNLIGSFPQRQNVRLGGTLGGFPDCKVTGPKPATTYYTIDWALSNPSLSPPSPKVGDLATFNVVVTQVSSDWPGALTVRLDVKLDGNQFDGMWVYQNQPIPVGITKTVSTKPWSATAGAHLVTWRLTFFGGDETVVITDPNPNNEASLQFSVGAGFDFALTLSPASITVNQGETANYQILISYSDPSYSGTTITIQGISGLGPGMNYQIIPSPPSLSISTSQATPTGTYAITLAGSAQGVTHQANAFLVVQPAPQPFDFSISASPPQQTMTPGGSATYTVVVAVVSGTAQNVALTVSGVPEGVTASLNPTSGIPSFNSILSITATSSAAPGEYMLTISGTAGATAHPTTVALTIGQSPDFRIDVSPPSQTSTQGQTTSYSVHVLGLNGFNSQVSLSATGLPASASHVFSIPSGTPDFTSALTVSLPSNVETGSFTITIKGSGGGLERYANIVLMINPGATRTQPATQTETTTQTPDFLGILRQNSLLLLGGLLVLIVIGALLALRRRPRHPPAPGYPCPTCGKPLTFVKEYDRWYCYNCKEYK